MLYITSSVIAYLVGGIPFGLLLGKLFCGVDIREKGSKNIGATNLMRICGVKIGIWGYILDILKGSIPALVLPLLFEVGNLPVLEIIIISSAIVGHIFPVYLYFKGGKGVSVALGGLLVVQTIPAFSSFIVFLIVVAISRYISLGSIIATTSFPIFIILKDLLFRDMLEFEFVIFGVILAVAVTIAHKSNIVRLYLGTENKLGTKTSD